MQKKCGAPKKDISVVKLEEAKGLILEMKMMMEIQWSSTSPIY